MERRALRFGILGAAQVGPAALIDPARELGHRVVAVAARDPAKARAYARAHGIDRAERSYDALLSSPDIDAVYVPLPPNLHAFWAVRALDAGKHVLCEKPFAANAPDAKRIVEAARAAGLVAMEGLHYRYHPLARRLRALIESNELGPVEHVEATLRNSIDADDVRYDLTLGGGATMDLGAYAIHWARLVAGDEPTLVCAQAVEGPPGIDVSVDAELVFPGGVTASLRYSMAADGFEASLRVRCRDGEIFVNNPLLPHYIHQLRIRRDGADDQSATVGGRSTYVHQLEAFAAAVTEGSSPLTSGADSVANMKVIDAIYRVIGMPLRSGPAMTLAPTGVLEGAVPRAAG